MSGAHFLIVGIFTSSDLAKSAALLLDDTLKAIAEWHENNPEESRIIEQEWPGPEPLITPVEENLSRKYEIAWELPVLTGYSYAISTYRNFLFLRNTGHTYTGAYPLDVFIERLGGTALVRGDYVNDPAWGELMITITCIAPDEQVAKEIAVRFHGSVGVLNITIEVEELFDGKSIKRFSESIPEIMDAIKEAGCRNIHVITTQRRNYYIDWDK